mmetsp:Transcript_4560/g.8264  ORF Transcript_4560/g.8264 Transcript_4560/m.8264 type:complete len:226 (-) Transcript_4560:388-1065(-)
MAARSVGADPDPTKQSTVIWTRLHSAAKRLKKGSSGLRMRDSLSVFMYDRESRGPRAAPVPRDAGAACTRTSFPPMELRARKAAWSAGPNATAEEAAAAAAAASRARARRGLEARTAAAAAAFRFASLRAFCSTVIWDSSSSELFWALGSSVLLPSSSFPPPPPSLPLLPDFDAPLKPPEFARWAGREKSLARPATWADKAAMAAAAAFASLRLFRSAFLACFLA